MFEKNIQIQTVVRINFRYLCLNHPIKNLNVRLDDVIHGNDISTYDVVVMENFKNLSVVNTTHRKTEIVVFNTKIIPK